MSSVVCTLCGLKPVSWKAFPTEESEQWSWLHALEIPLSRAERLLLSHREKMAKGIRPKWCAQHFTVDGSGKPVPTLIDRAKIDSIPVPTAESSSNAPDVVDSRQPIRPRVIVPRFAQPTSSLGASPDLPARSSCNCKSEIAVCWERVGKLEKSVDDVYDVIAKMVKQSMTRVQVPSAKITEERAASPRPVFSSSTSNPRSGLTHTQKQLPGTSRLSPNDRSVSSLKRPAHSAIPSAVQKRLISQCQEEATNYDRAKRRNTESSCSTEEERRDTQEKKSHQSFLQNSCLSLHLDGSEKSITRNEEDKDEEEKEV